MSLTPADFNQRLQRLENQILTVSHAIRQTNLVIISELEKEPTTSHDTRLRLAAINTSLSQIKDQK